MAQQLSAFDFEGRVVCRKVVAPTSAQAYREVVAEGIVNEAQSAVLALLKAKGGMTGAEVNAALGSPHGHKRLSELERLGKARTVTTRPCSITGRKSREWVAV